MITGPAAEWLESRRGELNQRFERARRRFPALSSEVVLSALAEILPPLAGPEPPAGDLLSAVYDLVLLHAGRDTFRRPEIAVLFTETFPALRARLLERPSLLPAALSNAVENVGQKGVAFARSIARVGPHVSRTDELLDAGAVIAWRLGATRFRAAVLEAGPRIGSRLFLEALDLSDFPDQAAPVVLAGLLADAWQHPRKMVLERTLSSLRSASPEQAKALAEAVARAKAGPIQPIGWVGEFEGFGGHFETPPLVLDGGNRHQLFARVAARDFVIEADIFGWECRPGPTIDLPIRSTASKSALARWVGKLTAGAARSDAELLSDGTVVIGGTRVRIPSLGAATSYAIAGDLIAATHADSHRIRIAVPLREPV